MGVESIAAAINLIVLSRIRSQLRHRDYCKDAFVACSSLCLVSPWVQFGGTR